MPKPPLWDKSVIAKRRKTYTSNYDRQRYFEHASKIRADITNVQV